MGQIDEIWEQYNPCYDAYDREVLARRKQQREIHKQEFKAWAAGKSYVFSTPEAAGITTDLRVGDIVSFTNDYGVEIAPLEVLGFRSADYWHEGSIYLNTDGYWCPIRLDRVHKLM